MTGRNLNKMNFRKILRKEEKIQLNIKFKRVIFTLKYLRKYFNTLKEVRDYYNNGKMHKSMYEDRIISLSMAYEIKKKNYIPK
ncbi:MAG: hypothetical protein ACP5LM_03450 [Thermoplasmata archaeon]|jgi:hypothetical protein